MELIEKIIEAIEKIDFNIYNEEYVDSILDKRDNDPFDSEWNRVADEIEELKTEENYTRENENEFLKIAQSIYTFLADNEREELAGAVEDDLKIIYDSLVLGYHDEWLDKIINVYLEGNIPDSI